MELEEKVNQINQLLKDLRTEKRKVVDNISIADCEVNKIYHEVECKNYDVVSGYKMLVKLQEQLRLRRYYKNELSRIQAVTDPFSKVNFNKINQTIKKVDNKEEKFHGDKLKLVVNK